ncbi:AfsR/SARP family transcriptional regulator [Salininema proteolyticum]|uniref:BTAD domain-containing putative transcriptional regulator n=1 Tax=Salininema proteolyticum TaxID=1607685 RepID=A0ABV8TZM8_9ACTN
MHHQDGYPGDRDIHARLLGPVRFECGGERLALPGAQLPKLLALLALRPGRPVPLDRAIALLWPDRVPEHGVRMAQNLVSRLRTSLHRAGHRGLKVERRTVALLDAHSDAERFEALAADARRAHRAGDHRAETSRYESALDLVRGEPLLGLDGPAFAAEASRLAALLDRTRNAHMEALLEAGEYERVLEHAGRALTRDPLSQQATRAAMIAQHHRGESQAACEAYRNLRDSLAEETGLDPNPELTETFEHILRGTLPADPAPPAPQTAGPVPRELPTAPAHFLGRDALAKDLADKLTRGGASGRPEIVAVNGAGGTGKSALAVHIAHSIAPDFPDGQLYVDLHGTTPGREPLGSGHVLHRFLRTLGATTVELPDDEEAAALYRTATAGKRILIVLDNARDAGQVRPLLPGGPGCAVIVTSRRAVASIDGAALVPLDVLDDRSALRLLTRASGRQAGEDREGVLAELAAHCGGLPLALCILAARLRSGAPEELDRIRDFMRRDADRLDEFADNERSLAASLNVGIRDLQTSPTGRQAVDLFRRIGLHSGPHIGPEAAAAMTATPVPEARRTMHALFQARLVEPAGPDRYRTHDVVRLFARRMAGGLPTEERDEALARLKGHYLQSARAAYALHDPRTVDDPGLPPEDPRIPRASMEGKEEAYEWLEAELPTMVELARRALAEPEPDREFAGRIGRAVLGPLMQNYSHISDLLHLARTASEAAAGPRRPWHGYAHRTYAQLNTQLRRFDTAASAFAEAKRIAAEDGDECESLWLSVNEARMTMMAGDHGAALAEFQRLLPPVRRLGLQRHEAWIKVYESLILDARGEVGAAVAAGGEAVSLARAGRLDVVAETEYAGVLCNHGFRLSRAGRRDEALEAFESVEGIVMARGQARSSVHAEALWGVAEIHHAEGRPADARRCWDEAAVIIRRLGLVDEETFQGFLRSPRPRVPAAFRL